MGGKLSRQEWRQAGAEQFMKTLEKEMKTMRPTVELSFNTFGLYQMKAIASPSLPVTGEEDLFISKTSPNFPNTTRTIGDFITPVFTWNIEDIYNEPKQEHIPMLQDWRLVHVVWINIGCSENNIYFNIATLRSLAII